MASNIYNSFDFIKLNNKYIQVDYADGFDNNLESYIVSKKFEFRLVDLINDSDPYRHYLAKVSPNTYGEYNKTKGFTRFNNVDIDNVEKDFIEFLLKTCIQYEKSNV